MFVHVLDDIENYKKEMKYDMIIDESTESLTPTASQFGSLRAPSFHAPIPNIYSKHNKNISSPTSSIDENSNQLEGVSKWSIGELDEKISSTSRNSVIRVDDKLVPSKQQNQKEKNDKTLLYRMEWIVCYHAASAYFELKKYSKAVKVTMNLIVYHYSVIILKLILYYGSS